MSVTMVCCGVVSQRRSGVACDFSVLVAKLFVANVTMTLSHAFGYS